jgi:arsenate reductase
MSNKKIIYFFCTRNSYRSQIAEGFGKKYLEDQFEVFSAGKKTLT